VNGVVSTLAGNGVMRGYADGVGVKAEFNCPEGICLDNEEENLYVADYEIHVIRKVTCEGGVTTTFAGVAGRNGDEDGSADTAEFAYPVGVCCDGEGNVFVTEQTNNKIKKINAAGFVSTVVGGRKGCNDGEGVHVQLDSPSALYYDRYFNAIIFVDTGNKKIKLLQ